MSDWAAFAGSLTGLARQLAQQSALLRMEDGAVELRVPPASRHLAEKTYTEKLRTALEEKLGKRVQLKVEVGETLGASAQDRAAESINQDAFVKGLMEQLDATIVDSSIKPAR